MFALGLIHANTGGSDSETVAYLEDQLRNNASHVVKHGACLGLGFTAMAAGTESLYDVIKETLDASDKAVAGEVRSLSIPDLFTPKTACRSCLCITHIRTRAHAHMFYSCCPVRLLPSHWALSIWAAAQRLVGL